jgi:hypothetical protein
MAFHAPRHENDRSETAFRVELPRACDAMGTVLRDVYDRDLGVPEDMASLLRKMNGRPATTRD